MVVLVGFPIVPVILPLVAKLNPGGKLPLVTAYVILCEFSVAANVIVLIVVPLLLVPKLPAAVDHTGNAE